MSAPRLLILGASPSYLGCIRAAREMGCTVLVADRNPQAPGLAEADVPLPVDIVDQAGILEAARRERIDGIVAVNDFGVPTAAYVAREMGLPGLPVDVAAVAVDKLAMRRAWERHGVPSVPFAEVSGADELLEAGRRLGYPLIVKPCNSRGGGSRGVRRVAGPEEAAEAYAYADSFYRDGRVLAERFVEGLEHSVEAIVVDGVSHVIAISDKIKSPLPYRVDDTILYPTVEAGERLRAVHEAVSAAVSAVGMTEGVAHVELSMTEDGPVLFELGARCGGGAPAPLVPYLTGVEEFKEAARLALGMRPERLAPAFMRGCVIKFVYPRPGVVRSVEVRGGVDSLPGVLAFHVFVKPGDEVRPLRTCSDRAGMVIAGAPTREEAHELANHVIDNVIVTTEEP